MLKIKALLAKILNWSGFGFDWREYETNNTTDTWVPVFSEGKIQHRVIPAGTPLVYQGVVSGDFNNLTTDGIFYSNNSMTANKPSGSSNYGYVVVLTNSWMITQTYFDSDGEVFIRTKEGAPATWHDWIALTGDGAGKQISSLSYTTTNGWGTVGNITIPKDGLYRIRASYSNAAVYGLAYGATNNANIVATTRLAEFATGGSINDVFFLPEGEWKFWAKCTTANVTNPFMIWKI